MGFSTTWQMEFTACLWALAFSLLLPNFILPKKRFLPLRVSIYLRSMLLRKLSSFTNHTHQRLRNLIKLTWKLVWSQIMFVIPDTLLHQGRNDFRMKGIIIIHLKNHKELRGRKASTNVQLSGMLLCTRPIFWWNKTLLKRNHCKLSTLRTSKARWL